jgi:hypothetical protein
VPHSSSLDIKKAEHSAASAVDMAADTVDIGPPELTVAESVPPLDSSGPTTEVHMVGQDTGAPMAGRTPTTTSTADDQFTSVNPVMDTVADTMLMAAAMADLMVSGCDMVTLIDLMEVTVVDMDTIKDISEDLMEVMVILTEGL